ncbi:MAG: ribosome maturation factor RimM [Dehalococcoidia bacterium]
MGQGHRQGRAYRELDACTREGCGRPRRCPREPGDWRLTSDEPAPLAKPRKPRYKNPLSTAKEPRPGFTAVGRVLRPHALTGEIRVLAYSPTARNLQRGRPVYLSGVRRVVERARQDHEHWILKIQGINNRNDVEDLRGELVEAADNDVQRDDDESYFIHELIGLKVVTTSGETLGNITEVLQTGANDVYVVKGDGPEIMVPAIGGVIEAINVSAGVVSITPLAGMLDETK